MTSKLPFGLKTKPTRRYVPNHSLAYKSRGDKLFGIVTYTSMESKPVLFEFEVTSKEQVEKLKKVETISELLKLTEVVQ